MTSKVEGVLAVLAAVFVLFSAMLDPRLSVVVSLVALLGYALYKLTERERTNDM
jgi:hypothetical protein